MQKLHTKHVCKKLIVNEVLATWKIKNYCVAMYIHKYIHTKPHT